MAIPKPSRSISIKRRYFKLPEEAEEAALVAVAAKAGPEAALAIRAPGTNVQQSFGLDQNGLPSIFGNTSTVKGFIEQYPGQTGARAIVRLPGLRMVPGRSDT